jgi:hypothetical protein
MFSTLVAAKVLSAPTSPVDISPQINSIVVKSYIANDEPVSLDQARQIRAMGFRLVRHPFINLENEEVVEETVRNYLRAGLRVVLDLHPMDREFIKGSEFWGYPARWNRIASRFRGQHLNDLVFEVLNEPDFRGKETRVYDAWMNLSIEAIRAVDPERWIVASNPFMSDPDYFGGPLGDWTPPKIKKLIVPMHYYRPYEITHPVSYRTQRRGAANEPYPPQADRSSDFTRQDYKNMAKHFRKYADWCKKHGVAPWIGEAGCHDDVPGREKWFQDVKKLAANEKLPVCWFSLTGFGIQANWNGERWEVRAPGVLKIILAK